MQHLIYPLVWRWQDGWQKVQESVVPEEPVRVVWAGGELLLWAWPVDLIPLSLGHILLKYAENEGIFCPTDRMSGRVVFLSDGPGNHVLRVILKARDSEGHLSSASDDPGKLCPEALLDAMRDFLDCPGACSGLWESTGCFHRAGLFDTRHKRFIQLAEDTSRHNCLDRLVGWASLHDIRPSEYVLFLSSRITGSLYARARRAGFRFLVSRGAVSSVLSEQHKNMTVVGFCRANEGRFTIFEDSGNRILYSSGPGVDR